MNRRVPVAGACCKTYLLEELTFCKVFPSPGYARCWPKTQCVPQRCLPCRTTSLQPWLLPQPWLPSGSQP